MHGVRSIPNGTPVVIEVPEANKRSGADEQFPDQATATVTRPSPSQGSFDANQGLVFVELDEEFTRTIIPRRYFVDPRFIGKRPEMKTETVDRMWVPATMLREVR